MNDDEIAALHAYKYRVNDVGALQEYDEYEVGYAEERVWVTGSEVLNAINTLSRAGHRSRLICYIELLRVHHNVLYTKKTDARHLLFGKNRCFKLRTCKLCERVPQCIYCYVHKKKCFKQLLLRYSCLIIIVPSMPRIFIGLERNFGCKGRVSYVSPNFPAFYYIAVRHSTLSVLAFLRSSA